MKLPSTLYFLRPGWWVVHVVSPAALFAGGIALGIFHATGHGASAEDAHSAHSAHSAPPPVTGSPIRDEMIDLQVAFDVMNRGVLTGRTDGIAEAFHAVHARREATAAAIAAGTAKPPRNADRMADFVARDDAFHTIVEATVAAAGRDDLPALQANAVEMFAACVACHAEFRDEAAQPQPGAQPAPEGPHE